MRGVVLFVSILALLASAGCGGSIGGGSSGNGGPSGVPATVKDSVPVDVGPTGVAVDTTTNEVYVVNFAGFCGVAPFSGVTKIDGATDANAGESFSIGEVEGTGTPGSADFTVTNVPVAIAADSATGVAYIFVFGLNCNCCPAATGHSHVVSFDLASTAVSTLSIGSSATWSPYIQHDAIAVNSATGKAYVANNLTTDILIIDLSSGALGAVSDPNVAGVPVAVAVNGTTNRIYVANNGGNISVIDGTNNLITTVSDPNASNPHGISVDPATNRVYVANLGSNNVTVIDGNTKSVTGTIPVGDAPVALDVNSNTNFIYVANEGTTNGDPGSVTVINGANNSTAMLTDPQAKNPSAVAVNSNTNKIYVANLNSNNVTVIDGAHD